jgi:branched-chain amino acid transport system permease protein
MELMTQQIVAGLAAGAIYSCIALAIVMIYQAIGHLNFAQGEMAMVSTYISWQLMEIGVPYWAAFVLTVVLSFAGAIIIEQALFKPLRRAPVLNQVVMFIALLSILNSLAGFIWGYSTRTFPSPFGSAPLFGSLIISAHQAGMLAVTLVLLILLYLFFRSTRMGLAMLGSAENPASARLLGIRVERLVALGWGMAAAIGAIAGMLIAPVVFLEPNMMLGILVYGFAGAVLGGLSSPGGAVVGGLAVGIIENLAGTFIPLIGGELKLTIALIIIIAVLVLKPSGLFRKPAVQRV